MPDLITCPSGLQATVRGLSADEIAVLADKDLFKDGTNIEEILRRCWVSTEEPGGYLMEAGAKSPSLRKMMLADRFFAYVQVRRQTWDDEYTFRIQCPSPMCRESFPHAIDLANLPFKEVPEESKAAFFAGRKLEARLGRKRKKIPNDDPDAPVQYQTIEEGKLVKWHIPTGEDQRRLLLMQKQAIQQANKGQKVVKNPLIDSLILRVDEIEGVESKNDFKKFLGKLDLKVAMDLFDQMDDADGGLETEILVRCPHCDHEWDFNIPFGQEFIFPKTRTGSK